MTTAVAEATEHGYLVICNGEVTAFRYGGSRQEVRMGHPKPIAQVLNELSHAGWKLCADSRQPTKGDGDYELKMERRSTRFEVSTPKHYTNTAAELGFYS